MLWSIIAIPVIIILGIFVFILSKSAKPGIKFMLLGLSIILVGGIITVDINSNLGGFEYLMVLIGLIISIVGFVKDN
ncbi:hypothetical protein [Halalkalibacter urbisdiaboli]|uniref:hypothetical protein n=1 Tax=Halalkalibacter urbisdiaboli TaxID=1960589 RepID=UPI000B43643C|nr:hypothetical protein [Halalkalibacter urbisdiaboli]